MKISLNIDPASENYKSNRRVVFSPTDSQGTPLSEKAMKPHTPLNQSKTRRTNQFPVTPLTPTIPSSASRVVRTRSFFEPTTSTESPLLLRSVTPPLIDAPNSDTVDKDISLISPTEAINKFKARRVNQPSVTPSSVPSAAGTHSFSDPTSTTESSPLLWSVKSSPTDTLNSDTDDKGMSLASPLLWSMMSPSIDTPNSDADNKDVSTTTETTAINTPRKKAVPPPISTDFSDADSEDTELLPTPIQRSASNTHFLISNLIFKLNRTP